MQRTLLGARHSHHSIQGFLSRNCRQYSHYDHTAKQSVASRRHISFPNFISHAPAERLAGTKPDELRPRTLGRGAHDVEDVSFYEGLRMGIDQALSRQRGVRTAKAELPPVEASLYGKWQNLSLDEDRMLYELDVNASDSTMVRLVNKPENEHDIQLWTCLAEFAHRRMGRDGIIMIWQSVSRRGSLFQVDGPLAPRFWQLVLDAAVSDEDLLRDVVSYAQWMHQTHDVRWPDMYHTVIGHMLQNLSAAPPSQVKASKEAVRRWHLALAPSFGPSENEFAAFMKANLPTRSGVVGRVMGSLYESTRYRNMFDIIIPHLYSVGAASQAVFWRRFLLQHNDLPMSLASRPFLRYMAVYYPRRLEEAELNVAGLVPNELDAEQPKSEPPEAAITDEKLSYLMNRVHGETFGITEKPYNDKLGAKWFASSWVSLDFAINVIYTMGVQELGPLSLQSIALREEGAPGVLQRIEQLRQLKIGLPKTNYVQIIGYYASVGDSEALQELLRSDIHPDVFDDEEAQHKLLRDCLRAGDWNTYQLVLRTRLAVLVNARAAVTDRVLESCIRQGKASLALKVMHDMSSQQFELTPATSHILSSFILRNLSLRAQTAPSTSARYRQLLDLNIALSRQVAATRFPPAVEVWRTLLLGLGRDERLADLERLCFDILRLYTNYGQTSAQPMWNAHMADVPPILRSESPFPHFQELPRDLPIGHEKHPLRQILDKRMASAIVRWGFTKTPYNRRAEGAAAGVLRDLTAADAGPATFHIARGIRLLAMLRDRGLYVNTMSVNKQATLRLMDLYRGGGQADYEWVGGNRRLRRRRHQLRFSLAEGKKLCDEAWGKGEVVPSLLELERRIGKVEHMDQVNEMRKKIWIMENPEMARKERGGSRL